MLTRLKPLILLILSFIVVTSCQKQLGFDTGIDSPTGTTGGTAIYSLRGAPGSCTGVIVNGNWKAGVALADTNTATIKVLVDSVGTYNITTASNNGIVFAAAGTFAGTGEQTIKLKASGTPTAPGSFNYTAGTNGCIFTVTVTGGVIPPATGECKSCSYIPVCVGAKYTYEVNSNGVESILQQELIAPETDTTVNGAVYRKIGTRYAHNNSSTNTNFGYYNCTNNTTTAFAYQVTSINGAAKIDFIKNTLLKANEPVSTTWTDIIINQGGQPVTMTFTLEEKDISHNVLGKTFDSVMHVTYTQTIDFMGNNIEAGKGDYFYAKHIGLIENYAEGFGMIGTWKLKDYFIP